MANTTRVYNAIKGFTEKRRQNRETFLQKKRAIEAYKGSEGYKQDLKKLWNERNAADAAAKAEYKGIIDDALQEMIKTNSARVIAAPTDEQIRILTVAQMLTKPAKPTLDVIAHSLGGNALALAALTDIAQRAWADDPSVVTMNYSKYATDELPASYVQESIKSLAGRCNAILSGTGADRNREKEASLNKKRYGTDYDPDELPQEEPYTSERDFYSRELSADYDLFMKAVN